MFIEDNNLEFRKSDNLTISVVVGLIGAHFSHRNETLLLLCEVQFMPITNTFTGESDVITLKRRRGKT